VSRFFLILFDIFDIIHGSEFSLFLLSLYGAKELIIAWLTFLYRVPTSQFD